MNTIQNHCFEHVNERNLCVYLESRRWNQKEELSKVSKITIFQLLFVVSIIMGLRLLNLFYWKLIRLYQNIHVSINVWHLCEMNLKSTYNVVLGQ